MPVREPAGLAISISGVLSAERLEPGHLVLAGRRHDVHHGQYLVPAVIGVKGTNVTS